MPENDVDTDIQLDRVDPPTYRGRELRWTGERIPLPGEIVVINRAEEGAEPSLAGGFVVGYFQAHGWLGVRVQVGQDVVTKFGAEIIATSAPITEGIN